MSTNSKNSRTDEYFSGGLAELVSSPTPLTYSFLRDWFKGNGSLGKAMGILNMPYVKLDLPVLVLIEGELLMDLGIEEETLYANTIFTYRTQKDLHQTPQLRMSFTKLLNPVCLMNTLRILLIQSQWIANPQTSVMKAKELVKTIPDTIQAENIQQIDEVLKEKVWTNVIAVGLISEFYNQLIIKEAKEKITAVNKYVSSKITRDDWFFRSIADQKQVKQGEMTFSAYIEKYGLRADKDYELTSPRWHEIPEIIKKRIDNMPEVNKTEEIDIITNKSLVEIANTSIELQLLRSEAKRKTLLFINKLRQILLQEAQNVADIGLLTKEDVKRGNIQHEINQEKITVKPNQPIKNLSLGSGKGISVSQGNAGGIVKNITDNDMKIPKGTVGIFPNASPEFAIQYPKCTGMIFLKGGQTSHGAIVAREFNIPAIIDSKIEGIKDEVNIELNGATGEWHIL